MQGATREIFSRRLFFFHGIPMADPLITDEQLAEAATNPVAASDDAGSVSMPSIADLIALRKYLDASTGGTGGKPRNPFKVLGGMQSTAAHRRLD